MLKISTMFKNKIPTANLIFKNEDNEGINLLYYPELPNRGTGLINLYKKKSYWDYVIIPKVFSFMGLKILTNAYYKDFKKEIPQVRIQRKFMKNGQETRSVMVDLTSLSEDFAALAKSRSKKMLMETFFTLVEQFSHDNEVNTGKDFYIVVDGDNTNQKDMISSILYYSRLNNNKLRIAGVDGIVLYGNRRFWPMTISESDKDGKYLKVNINVLARYMKEVHLEDIEEVDETPEESLENTKKIVESLYKVHIGRKTTTAAKMFTDEAKKGDDTLEENPLEMIKAEVNQNPHLEGKNFEQKLSNLFKEEKVEKIASEKGKGKGKQEPKIPKMIKTINENLEELNRQYNGVKTLNETTIDKNANSFYKPLNIIGFKDFHAFDKQKTEFGENLDQAMFDLIKSIETDKELNIKILNIKTSITDTYQDRLKTYKIKVQHKGFGYKKPYTVSFHVPIPSKGKYLKVGGNDYIMVNQLFSKPVVKVNPKMVRMYTHYSTCAVHLKHHAINDSDGVDALMESVADTLKYGKKLIKKPEILTKEEIEELKAKYDLPEFMNNDIFVNLSIKT